jgi:hypothetical protein
MPDGRTELRRHGFSAASAVMRDGSERVIYAGGQFQIDE